MTNLLLLISRLLHRYLEDLISKICFVMKAVSLRAYTIWKGGGFKKFGNNILMEKFSAIKGDKYIEVGDSCYFNYGTFLTAYKVLEKKPTIVIGKNCSFGQYNHITCINQITVGDNCLTGKWVTITDNSHGEIDKCSLEVSPLNRKLSSKGSVNIGSNVWIGDKVTILPGVTIGDCSVIAANSVVTKDIPPLCVVGGNPAKIIKDFR